MCGSDFSRRKPAKWRAIRALEIGRDRPDEAEGTYQENKAVLTEELGDVLGNLLVIANRYDISFEEILTTHKQKLEARYSSSGKRE